MGNGNKWKGEEKRKRQVRELFLHGLIAVPETIRRIVSSYGFTCPSKWKDASNPRHNTKRHVCAEKKQRDKGSDSRRQLSIYTIICSRVIQWHAYAAMLDCQSGAASLCRGALEAGERASAGGQELISYCVLVLV